MADPSHDLISLLDRWRTTRVLVVGDFMLDRYVYGNAERLSPDAPVPVLTAERQTHTPGGAANVCMQLRALRAEVCCVGIVGRDDAADHLRDGLRQHGCDVAGLIACPDRPTTVKHNFVGLAQHRHPQKMFRVDDERSTPIDHATADQLLAVINRLLPDTDIVCLEDYNKGVLTEPLCQAVIAAAERRGVPVLVDPAAIRDYAKYRHATCITPNRTEAALATDHPAPPTDTAELTDLARRLLRELQLQTVVLTLDKQGALLVRKGRRAQLLPTRAREVYDVTGAGDMILAMLAAARANGIDWPAALELANVAAGLEVERFGVVPISVDQVLLAVLQRDAEQLGKLRPLELLLTELAAHRAQGKRLAFTNGCFDILHAGHVAFLREARRQGDLLIVALNSDASIRRIKGPNRPVNHEADRVMVLSELQSVDYIVLFDDDTPSRLIEAVRPDVLVKGADYTRERVVGHELVEAYGGRVALVPLIQGRSTTNIIRRIEASVSTD